MKNIFKFRRSWFGNLNYFLLQFLFIRLYKEIEGDKVNWGILGLIFPFTGWSYTPYIYLLSIKVKLKLLTFYTITNSKK